MRGARELGVARVDGEEVGVDGRDVRAARARDHRRERAEALAVALERVYLPQFSQPVCPRAGESAQTMSAPCRDCA
jgi:hypothetical protein